MFSDCLGLVIQAGDGEMTGKDRHRITEDEKSISEENPFLNFRQIMTTEKTGPLINAFSFHVRESARDSSRVVLNADEISFTNDFPRLHVLQGFVTLI